MDANQLPVLGALNVELETDSQFKASPKVCQGVFWGVL